MPSVRAARPMLTMTRSTTTDLAPSLDSKPTVSLAGSFDARDADAAVRGHSSLGQRPGEGLGKLLVGAGQDVREGLEQRDLGSEVAEQDANSQPTAPAPMMATRCGISSSSST